MKKTYVVMNTQHSLMPEQETLLNTTYPEGYEIVGVPADGWTRSDMDTVMNEFDKGSTVVFISPIPYMIKELSASAALNWSWVSSHQDYPYALAGDYNPMCVMVMANDQRVKKELPNGKVISVVATTGWYLV